MFSVYKETRTMEEISPKRSELKKSCVNCGAELFYAPGTVELKCRYCGHAETITPSENGFEELELKSYLSEMGGQSHSEEITMIHCKNCGADQHIGEHYKSLHCIYCSMPLIAEETFKDDWIIPGAILPFQIDQKKAFQIFINWVKKLWFAPNKLKKASLDPQNTKGLYSPYWTFDANLFATYTGQRGTYYYVTRTAGSGKNRRTVTERRTSWTPASGTISGFIDDTLTKASKQHSGIIPKKIANWDLKLLKPFDSSFLAGFITEKYTISLNDGHLESEKEAQKIADRWVRRDIGGDTQRVSSIDMKLSDETFKHILLPVYISAYIFKGKRYNFFVNGQTGALSGKRPYSFWKIFFFIFFIIIAISIIILILQ